MPRLGAKLAPPPSDVDEIKALGTPVESDKPFDESMDAEWAGGFDKWTSPEARAARANHVTHTKVAQITLYDLQGNDRTVDHADLELLTDLGLEPHKRLYVRCPRCERMSNRGIHPFGGPNACPAKPQQKFMTCPICAQRGVNKRVYEELPPEGSIEVTESDDPNYVDPGLPGAATRDERLRERLGAHMTAFHSAEAQTLYGVRREPSGNGFRNVWSRD